MSEAAMPPQPPRTGETPAALSSDEKMWGMFCHLSGLLGYFAAFMTFVGPLICWLMKKDTSWFVDQNGKEALNFHLNVLAYNLIGLAGIFLTCFIGAIVFGPLLLALNIYVIIVQIIAGLKANNGESFRYPYIYRVIQ
jgi:uncharacterized Tic20 family protein